MTPRTALTLPPTEIVGPYSPWPRKPAKRWAKPAAVAGSAATAAFALHCLAPMVV